MTLNGGELNPPVAVADAQPALEKREKAERALMLFDIVSSEQWLRRLGDVAYADLNVGLKEIVVDIVSWHGGATVCDTGDGVLSAFDSVDAAVAAATAIHGALHLLPAAAGMQLRFAVHHGSAVRVPHGLVGVAVYETFDLCDSTPADRLWVSDVARVELDRPIGRRRLATLKRAGAVEVAEVAMERAAIDEPDLALIA